MKSGAVTALSPGGVKCSAVLGHRGEQRSPGRHPLEIHPPALAAPPDLGAVPRATAAALAKEGARRRRRSAVMRAEGRKNASGAPLLVPAASTVPSSD